jgi:hypothetical protein
MSTPPTDNSVGTEELSILVVEESPERAKLLQNALSMAANGQSRC